MVLLRLSKNLVPTTDVIVRSFSSHPPRVCVVGSGPAAFSVTQTLLKYNASVHVDMMEKYPVPFGLVRYGVSPDHQDVKNCTNGYDKVADNNRFSFYGNVNVGSDVKVSSLCDSYHAVVLCHGAQGERKLNIEGENLSNVFTANQFVGWYNGVPGYQDLKINVKGKSAVVVGVGNVALDCARMLLKPTDSLKATDMTNAALEHLETSLITDIHVVGRRGPLQMACSRKEFSEITDLNNVATFTDPSYFTANVKKVLKKRDLSRRKYQRLVKYFMKMANSTEEKTLHKFFVHLLMRPTKILSKDGVSVSGVEFQKVSMNDKDDAYNPHFELLDKRVVIDCDMVISCIGYNPTHIKSNLIEYKNGRIRNQNGVVDKSRGLYACGWCATGPIGVLADTSNSGHDVAGVVLGDLEELMKVKGSCERSQTAKNTVSWSQWKSIDQYETDYGRKVGKIREKVLDINEMISLSRSSKSF